MGYELEIIKLVGSLAGLAIGIAGGVLITKQVLSLRTKNFRVVVVEN